LIELLKRTAFRGIAATERTVRVFGGASPSLDPADLRKIRNFLIPQVHPFLGAAVHETPLIESLRSAVPEANIVAVGSGIGAEVLRNHPGVARLEPSPDPNQDFWQAVRSYRRVVRSFRGEPWCALFTGWNGRSRVLLATMLAGSGVRAGFSVAPPLAHLSLAYDPEKSQIANNLLLPGLLGHQVSRDPEPRVYYSVLDRNRARALLARHAERPTAILITRTSGGQPTQWPDDRFTAVARHLIERHGCRVVLPGTANDATALNRLAECIGPDAESLAGKTSIPQLAAVCALSNIAVAVDTGAMHVARAQGLPLAIIAPGWQSSMDWMPLGKSWARILKGPWFPPPPPPNYAIEEVSVVEVNAAVDELLCLFPPSAASGEARVQRSLVGLSA
jgi:ADP-heptose:LPS heptosyltransferase